MTVRIAGGGVWIRVRVKDSSPSRQESSGIITWRHLFCSSSCTLKSRYFSNSVKSVSSANNDRG